MRALQVVCIVGVCQLQNNSQSLCWVGQMHGFKLVSDHSNLGMKHFEGRDEVRATAE
jgi:hypothetical protein